MQYETPLSYLRRLLEHDDSDKFRIIINLIDNNNNNEHNESSEENKIIFTTTKNKSRVISKRINDIYQIDPTINEYSINLPKQIKMQTSNQTKEDIEDVLSTLIKSIIDKVEINETQRDIFSIITTILNGSEDKETGIKYDMKNEEEAISLLRTEFHFDSIEYLSFQIIEFIRSSSMKNIEEGIINEIIDEYISVCDKDGDKKESEKRQIFDALKEQEEKRILMHFLLSLDIEEYDEDMIEYIYDNLDDEIIDNEISRVICTLRSHILKIIESNKNEKKKKTKTKTKIEKECEYNGNELSGIIDYLQKQNGADLESNNILKLSGGGVHNPAYPITNLIKYNSNNMSNEFYYNYYSGTPSSSDGWIEFDFLNKTINLTSYTIRTGGYYPKSWRIVGSNDHQIWEDIDHRVNNSELKGDYKQHRFENTKSDKSYRYIRYIQEEEWSGSQYNYFIHLTRIEFFGSISSPKS